MCLIHPLATLAATQAMGRVTMALLPHGILQFNSFQLVATGMAICKPCQHDYMLKVLASDGYLKFCFFFLLHFQLLMTTFNHSTAKCAAIQTAG